MILGPRPPIRNIPATFCFPLSPDVGDEFLDPVSGLGGDEMRGDVGFRPQSRPLADDLPELFPPVHESVRHLDGVPKAAFFLYICMLLSLSLLCFV